MTPGVWQSIDTADKPDEDAPEVLLLDALGRRYVAQWDGAAGHWQGIHAFDGVERVEYFQEWPGRIYNPVAWMPLPAPRASLPLPASDKRFG